MKKSAINVFFTISLILFSGDMLPVCAAWSPPLQISEGQASLNVGATPLVIDSNSNALVGWLDGEIGVAQTLSSASLFSQANVWTLPQTIYNNTIPGSFPSFPTMSIDVFGNQTAGFGVTDLSGIFVLNASRRSLGALNWEAPITQAQTGNPSGGSLAIGNHGNFAALLALSTTGAPPFAITLVQLPAVSSSWLPALVLAQDNSLQPVVAAKAHEAKATLAWKVNIPSLQIQTIEMDLANQQMSSVINVPLPPLTTDIVGMDVAMSFKGDAILIYIAQTGPTFILYSSTLLAGQNTWSAPLLISNPANSVIGASIAADADGNATIVWGEEMILTQQFVRAATLPLEGTPIFVTNLTSPTNLNTTVDVFSKVVMDSFGNAAAIWGITTDGVPMIQVSSKAVGQNWTSPETLSLLGVSPLITLSDQGTAVAAWLDAETNVLIGSRNAFLFPLTPPSKFKGKVVKNEFLTETAYFLKMHWNPSPAPNIVSYEILKNGKVIATIPGDGVFKFLQPLHSKHVKGKYVLEAIASNGNRNSVPLVIKR